MKITIGVTCCLLCLCLVGALGQPTRYAASHTPTLALSLAAAQGEKRENEKFSALAYLPSGAGRRMVGAGSTANIDLYINDYTGDEEAKALAGSLLDGGPNVLLKALEKRDAIGKITLSGRVGFYDLKLIRSHKTHGGRQIYAVGDRPMGFLELYYSGISRDYEFGILMLDLKKNKKGIEEGQGTLIYAAKIKVLKDKKIELENYGVQPVRLMGVRKLT